MTKLLKSKWYIVDLETKLVAVDRCYGSLMVALDTETGRRRKHFEATGRKLGSFVTLSGRHIRAHEGKPWIVP